MTVLRFLCLAAALNAAQPAFAAAADAQPHPAPSVPAAAPSSRQGAKVAAISAPFVIHTADGLPVEVELLACFKGQAQLRNTASGRVFQADLAKLDKEARKLVTSEMRRIQAKIEQLPAGFGVRLESNTGAAPRVVSIRPDLALEVQGASGVSGADNAPRSIPGFGACVRFAAQLPAGIPVDLPVHVKIIWAYQGTGGGKPAGGGKGAVSSPGNAGGAGGMDNVETVRAILVNTPGEYLSKPVGKSPRPLRGFGVVVINAANGAVLWRGGDGSVVRDYLAANPDLAAGK
ncbi:MAG: hypothetical protein LBG65_06355 [Puniceicoccales bacterium]|nr:hypothetical protein [Puniceicoccales bacterium]